MMIGKFWVVAGLVTALAVACVAQDEAKTAAQAELNSGVKAFKSANYEEAIDHFNKAVNLDPELMLARQYLATSYSQQFRPGVDTPENVVWTTNALEQYSEILQHNPSDVYSMKGIAYLKLQLKDFEQAREYYAKAITLDSSDPASFYSIGVIDWSLASRDITAEKAKLDAESEYSLISSEDCRAVRAKSLADVDSGIAMLTKAISLRKDYIDAMAYMSQLYRLRAELECGSKKNFKADIKQSDEWADRAAAARKKEAETPATDEQEKPPDKPRL